MSSIDKGIAAKMFNPARLNRMKNNEIRKVERERNLMSLKQTTLPVLEAEYSQNKDSKCGKCNQDKETYGMTYEWILEPVDVFDVESDKGFYGFNKYDRTRSMLSKIMSALIIHPAKIKMMQYLQQHNPDVPIIFILKSKDKKLDQEIINFILETYDIKRPETIDASNEASIKTLLSNNSNMMIFINDNSQLKMILKANDYGKFKKVYLLPISINYEIQNTEMFKPVWSIIPRVFYHNYGRVQVSFHEPYTYEDISQWIKKDNTSEDAMTEAIYDHILHDIVFKRSIMSTNILAYLLLTYFRKGGTLEEFSAKVDEIRGNYSKIDFSFEGKAEDIIKYALKILDKKISINDQLIIRPLEETHILIELWDYAETLLCHFALESAVILSAEHFKRIDDHIDYNRMLDLAVEFCEIIHFEIPFTKPCCDLREQLIDAFEILSRNDILSKPVAVYTENEMRARKIADYFDDLDDDEDYSDDSIDEYLNPKNQITINLDKQKEINALKDILLPIQETYMNVAYCMKRMIGYKNMKEDFFLKLSMDAMVDECWANQCKYWESCSMKWMKNSLKLFEHWGVIGKLPFSDVRYHILKEYNSEGEIDKLAKHIEQFSDY